MLNRINFTRLFGYFLLTFGFLLNSCAAVNEPLTNNAVEGANIPQQRTTQLTTNPFNSRDFVDRVFRFAVEQKTLPTKSEIETLFGAQVSQETCPEGNCHRVFYRFETAPEKYLYAQYFFTPKDPDGISGLDILRVPSHQSKEQSKIALTYWSINDLISKYNFSKQIGRHSPHLTLHELRYSFPLGFLTIGFESNEIERAEIISLEIVWQTTSSGR